MTMQAAASFSAVASSSPRSAAAWLICWQVSPSSGTPAASSVLLLRFVRDPDTRPGGLGVVDQRVDLGREPTAGPAGPGHLRVGDGRIF